MQGPIYEKFFIDFSSNKAKFLTDIFIDEIRSVVTEKNDSEKRHASKLKAFLKFRNNKFQMQGTESTILQRNGLPQVESFRLRS